MSKICRRCRVEIDGDVDMCGNCGLANPGQEQNSVSVRKSLLRIGEALGAILLLKIAAANIQVAGFEDSGLIAMYTVGIGIAFAAMAFTFGRHRLAFGILRLCAVIAAVGALGLLLVGLMASR